MAMGARSRPWIHWLRPVAGQKFLSLGELARDRGRARQAHVAVAGLKAMQKDIQRLVLLHGVVTVHIDADLAGLIPGVDRQRARVGNVVVVDGGGRVVLCLLTARRKESGKVGTIVDGPCSGRGAGRSEIQRW